MSSASKELRDLTNQRLNTPGTKGQKDPVSQSTPTKEKSKLRSFFSGFRGKRKPEPSSQVEVVASKPSGQGRTVSNKKGSSRLANKKNITDGAVDIIVDDSDLIKEDYDVEFRENIHELLEVAPIRTHSVLERNKPF